MNEKYLYCTDELLEQVMGDSCKLDFATPLEVEEYAKENGLVFSKDDMSNCYLSRKEEQVFNCVYKLM